MLVGQEFGPFFIEKELGTGAMGAVYLARYLKNNHRVAIKIMSQGISSSTNSSLVARFEREAEILKHLNHINIVKLFGIGKFKGMRYYAMEVINGETLEAHLLKKKRFSVEEAIDLGKQICSALQNAHDNGVVHRDIKLSNLMLTKEGVLKLTDFGIAKDLDGTLLTGANCAIGTAAYMSPEQCRGERTVTGKSDLYSLGIVLYEMLTGRRPFNGENAVELFLHHVQSKPERPSRINLEIPKFLDTLILHLLEKNPNNRPHSASVVCDILEEINQKIIAQTSVGEDLAKSYGNESSSTKTSDQKKARRLLARLGKKNQKALWYSSGWFVALSLLTVLSCFSWIMYEVFIRPPSAKSLFSQAETMIKANNRTEAREGPLEKYLQLYGRSEDSQKGKMKSWADEIDVEQCEELLRKYLKQTARGFTFGVQEEIESNAFKAIKLESEGNFEEADKAWLEIGKQNPQSRWAVLGENRRKLFATLPRFELAWSDSLRIIRDSGNDPEIAPAIIPVFIAFRTEQIKDNALAIARYKESKEKFEKDTDRACLFDPALRLPYLLCNKKIKELAGFIKGDPEAERNKLIEKLLAEASSPMNTLLDGRYNCLNILAVYSGQPGVEKYLDQSRVQLKKFNNEIQN